MARIRKFITEKEITFSDSEMLLVKKSRDKRNDVIHGRRNVDVSTEELDKLRSLIERLILARLHDKSTQ
jgi:hypothetical protein